MNNMNNEYVLHPKSPTRDQSPTEIAFEQIDISLKCLSESIERLGMKTNDIRYTWPRCGGAEDCDKPSASPVVLRLHGIQSEITRRVEQINSLIDEIQL